eukprot:2217143-Alexandrium_andersonii.AAC.1
MRHSRVACCVNSVVVAFDVWHGSRSMGRRPIHVEFITPCELRHWCGRWVRVPFPHARTVGQPPRIHDALAVLSSLSVLIALAAKMVARGLRGGCGGAA